MKPVRPIATAGAILLFVAVVDVAFSLLVARFGYDDVLREPAATILIRFAAGGTPLILIWLLFALGCLFFIPVSVLIGREVGVDRRARVSIVTVLGIASSLLQAVGLLRWVFVVPGLAAVYVSDDASGMAREAAVAGFRVVHSYGGTVVGEFLGQLFLVTWTIGVSIALWRSGRTWRLLGAAGLATVPMWLLGFSELLAPLLPRLPLLEFAPVAFMALEAWLTALALVLLRDGVSRWRNTRPASLRRRGVPATSTDTLPLNARVPQ